MANPVLWFEVLAKDGKALRRFYADVFGWEISAADGANDYGLVAPGDGGIGGGIGTGREARERHLTFFVDVDDPAAYLAAIEKAGGKTITPPTEVPEYGLTFAYFQDPEGNTVGLTKGVKQLV